MTRMPDAETCLRPLRVGISVRQRREWCAKDSSQPPAKFDEDPTSTCTLAQTGKDAILIPDSKHLARSHYHLLSQAQSMLAQRVENRDRLQVKFFSVAT